MKTSSASATVSTHTSGRAVRTSPLPEPLAGMAAITAVLAGKVSLTVAFGVLSILMPLACRLACSKRSAIRRGGLVLSLTIGVVAAALAANDDPFYALAAQPSVRMLVTVTDGERRRVFRRLPMWLCGITTVIWSFVL